MPGLTDEHHDWFDRVLGVNTRPTQAADAGDAAGGGSAADGGGDETTLGQLLGGVTSGFEGVGAAFAGATEALIPPIEGGTDIAIDPTSQPYQAGYQDGLANVHKDHGPLNDTARANYEQGWKDGSLNRTEEGKSHGEEAKPTVDARSEAYQAGYDDAMQGKPQIPGPRDDAGIDNYNQGWFDGKAIGSAQPPSTAFVDLAFSEAVERRDWVSAARLMNWLSPSALSKRLAQLDPDTRRIIHDVAVASPSLGPQSRIAIESLMAPSGDNQGTNGARSGLYDRGYADGLAGKAPDTDNLGGAGLVDYNQGWADGNQKRQAEQPAESAGPAATPAGGRFRIRMFEGSVGADPSRDSRFTFALWDVENGLVAAYSLTGAVLRGRGPRAPGGGGGDWSKPFELSRPLGLDQFGDRAELVEGNGGAWSIRIPAAGATAEVATALSEAYGIDSGAGTFTYLPGSVRKSTG